MHINLGDIQSVTQEALEDTSGSVSRLESRCLVESFTGYYKNIILGYWTLMVVEGRHDFYRVEKVKEVLL